VKRARAWQNGPVRRPRTIRVTRYVTPLREGGSLPAIVEADDDGMYVLKFRGAGQGPRALVAELISGEIARVLGLPIPEIVLAELDPELGRTEPDPEIHALILDSAGTNLAVDYLPGSVTFDPAVHALDSGLAARIVWFDALVTNVDRTVRNTNVLVWHRRPWLIDHGATLYFHHSAGWESDQARPRAAFPLLRTHVLLHQADRIREIDDELTRLLDGSVLDTIVGWIPDSWLAADDAAGGTERLRAAYASYLRERLAPPRPFVVEASGGY
jgi:hypothetical protein